MQKLTASCAGWRMNEQAAHLVDRVLPHVPYRQWVLTQSSELARVVVFDGDLIIAVFGVFADELSRWQRERANDVGIADPQTGSLLEIQRFADGVRIAAGFGAQRPWNQGRRVRARICDPGSAPMRDSPRLCQHPTWRCGASMAS